MSAFCDRHPQCGCISYGTNCHHIIHKEPKEVGKIEMLVCIHCDKESENEELFLTDVNAGQKRDSMTCESCYDLMDVGEL